MDTNTLILGDMKLSVEVIDRDTALKMLSNNKANRAIKPRYVNQYARDMINQKWRLKPLAICFLPDGSLGNGQHTLRAIALTEKPQTLLVARNVPKSTIAIMDRGATRTVSDVAKFVGDKLSRNEAAIVKILVHDPSSNAVMSYDEIADAYSFHKDVIEFVVREGKHEKGVNGTILAVCARAAYTYPLEKVAEFIKVLGTGIGTENQSAAIRLRDVARNIGRGQRGDLYGKTQTALYAFLRDKPINRLFASSDEYFEIPVMVEKSAPKYDINKLRECEKHIQIVS